VKGRLTLRELRDWYVDKVRQEKLAERTIYLRKNAMDRLMRFAGEDCPAKNVTRERLNDFKRELLVTNSPAGARILLSKLAGVFKKGFYENKLIAHPFVGFEYPRGKGNRRWPVLSPDEMLEVRALFQSEQMRLAWDIARFTAIRPSALNGLEAQNISDSVIRFYVPKLGRFEEVLIHANLRPYLEPLRGKSGRVFSFRYWGSIDAEFGTKIKRMKGDDFRPSGGYTPRKSLGSYLRNDANWRHEDIKLFLTHHRNDVTWLYTNDQPERIRSLVEALPFR
jgi:hypothetical protein